MDQDLRELGDPVTLPWPMAANMAPRCLRPTNSKPELMLLVNGARFDLGGSFGGVSVLTWKRILIGELANVPPQCL